MTYSMIKVTSLILLVAAILLAFIIDVVNLTQYRASARSSIILGRRHNWIIIWIPGQMFRQKCWEYSPSFPSIYLYFSSIQLLISSNFIHWWYLHIFFFDVLLLWQVYHVIPWFCQLIFNFFLQHTDQLFSK